MFYKGLSSGENKSFSVGFHRSLDKNIIIEKIYSFINFYNFQQQSKAERIRERDNQLWKVISKFGGVAKLAGEQGVLAPNYFGNVAMTLGVYC